MLHSAKAKAERRNVATQTSDIDTMLEIARLQEQVKLLTIEVDYLRKYNSENPQSVLKPISPATSPINESLKHSDAKHNGLENQSLSIKNNKIIGRGCNCKGKCASKICGCVKKNYQCGEWCKCNSGTCQNQESKDKEQNKENLEHNHLTEKRSDNPQIINKRLEQTKAQKGLFSPEIDKPDPVLNEGQFSTTPLYFASPKTLTFGSDEEPHKQEENSRGKKSKKHITDDTKVSRQRRGREKKNNLEVNNTEYVRKLRSVSNEEKQRQSYGTEEEHAFRRCNSTEITTNDNELRQIEKRTNNYIQNIKQGMVSLRRGQRGAKQSKETKVANHSDSNEETSPVSVNDNKNTTQNNRLNETVELIVPQEIPSSTLRTPNANKSSDVNEGNDNDFDPMKPKHELPRTPVRGGNDETISSNTSEIFIPTPIITTQEEEPEVPELSQPQVDWEEYQSQLVACDKCKRKFHPLRIKKHQSCCKKV